VQRPTHAGDEKYLADFWIIEAPDLDVALTPATEGSKACNRKDRGAAKAAGRASAGAGVQRWLPRVGSFTTA
jgi:hypothetical protein